MPKFSLLKTRIPRPSNSFMIYRRQKNLLLKSNSLSSTYNDSSKELSTKIATLWKNEPQEVKDMYKDLAEKEKAVHQLKYPDYKFVKTPGKKTLLKRAAKLKIQELKGLRNTSRSSSDRHSVRSDFSNGTDAVFEVSHLSSTSNSNYIQTAMEFSTHDLNLFDLTTFVPQVEFLSIPPSYYTYNHNGHPAIQNETKPYELPSSYTENCNQSIQEVLDIYDSINAQQQLDNFSLPPSLYTYDENSHLIQTSDNSHDPFLYQSSLLPNAVFEQLDWTYSDGGVDQFVEDLNEVFGEKRDCSEKDQVIPDSFENASKVTPSKDVSNKIDSDPNDKPLIHPSPQTANDQLLTCSTCPELPVFINTNLKRTHFKLDSHKYNVKLKSHSKPPLTLDQFDLLNLDDTESIDGSDDDEEEEEEVRQHSSPFVKFGFLENEFAIYKQLLQTENDDVVERMQDLLGGGKTWGFLMVGSGHFAGAIMQCKKDGKALAQKTFHRYTTRRKQGGAQSASDNKNGAAKSAGSTLRRYNEMALQEDIKNLLISWKSLLSNCDLVFIRVASTQRKLFFFDQTILDFKNQKVRNIPFTTKRATFSELQRVFNELLSIKKILPTKTPTTPEQQPKKQTQKKQNDQQQQQPPKQPDAEGLHHPNETLQFLIEAVKKGKVPLLQNHILQNSIDLSKYLTKFRDQDGISLLHVAAKSGNHVMITFLLEAGADPLVRAMGGGNSRPFDFCVDKKGRDAFMEFNLRNPGVWDYEKAGIPKALNEEEAESQRAKLAEKKKKQREKDKLRSKEKKKTEKDEEKFEEKQERKPPAILKLSRMDLNAVGMSPEARMKIDREKRALAAEARMRTLQNKCGCCNKSLVGVTPFGKFNFKYCSVGCVQKHQILAD